jgi:hypothetical protein
MVGKSNENPVDLRGSGDVAVEGLVALSVTMQDSDASTTSSMVELSPRQAPSPKLLQIFTIYQSRQKRPNFCRSEAEGKFKGLRSPESGSTVVFHRIRRGLPVKSR